MDKIIEFNQTQLRHVRIVQKLVMSFCSRLMAGAIEHDVSKFGPKEYATFVASVDSLAAAKSGFDPEYQKQLNTEAIQHHILNNPHHPEAWPRGEMPFEHIVAMFFDWLSRSIEKGTSMDDFWEYNLAKLKEHQPHAIPIVETMKRDFPVNEYSWTKHS